MSDYSHRPGGKLKLKGDDSKKKKKKSHSTADRAHATSSVAESSRVAERGRAAGRDERAPYDDDDEALEREAAPRPAGRKMTETERKFEETQRQRREERAQKTANLTHKDRIAAYNAKLDAETEHHDLPRISAA